jgi:hypothetical protein
MRPECALAGSASIAIETDVHPLETSVSALAPMNPDAFDV